MIRFALSFVFALTAVPAVAQTQGWGDLNAEKEAGFSWTAPLWPGFWMAWTPATFALFVAIFAAIGLMVLLEIRKPGGDARQGVLGLVTTRGDRLFISLLGSSYIFLAWLFFIGMPLWGPLGLSILWFVFTFWKV
jgi:predicted small integral membrane protein